MALLSGVFQIFETARIIQDLQQLAREVIERALSLAFTIAPTELHGIFRRRPS